MAEQLTRVTGRLKQKDDAPFFIVNTEDIDASDIGEKSSSYPTTSLKEYLKNLDTVIKESTGVEPIPVAEITALFNKYKGES